MDETLKFVTWPVRCRRTNQHSRHDVNHLRLTAESHRAAAAATTRRPRRVGRPSFVVVVGWLLLLSPGLSSLSADGGSSCDAKLSLSAIFAVVVDRFVVVVGGWWCSVCRRSVVVVSSRKWRLSCGLNCRRCRRRMVPAVLHICCRSNCRRCRVVFVAVAQFVVVVGGCWWHWPCRESQVAVGESVVVVCRFVVVVGGGGVWRRCRLRHGGRRRRRLDAVYDGGPRGAGRRVAAAIPVRLGRARVVVASWVARRRLQQRPLQVADVNTAAPGSDVSETIFARPRPQTCKIDQHRKKRPQLDNITY